MLCPFEEDDKWLYHRVGSNTLSFTIIIHLLSLAYCTIIQYCDSISPRPSDRHGCRNDGFSGLAGLVYNDERSGV